MQGIFCTAVDTKPSNKSHINCLYEQLIATAVTLANRKKKHYSKKPFCPVGCVCVSACMHVCVVKCCGCKCQERKSPVQAKG